MAKSQNIKKDVKKKPQKTAKEKKLAKIEKKRNEGRRERELGGGNGTEGNQLRRRKLDGTRQFW